MTAAAVADLVDLVALLEGGTGFVISFFGLGFLEAGLDTGGLEAAGLEAVFFTAK